MANFLNNNAYQQLVFGPLVTKSTLPSNATGALFTVSTGNILITSFAGILTHATTVATVTLALGAAPTTGTASTTSIASATSVGTRETGTMLGVQASSGLGGALVVGANGGANLFLTPIAIMAAPGTITATTSAATGAGAAATWYMTYVPLDPGAFVS